MEFNSKGNIVYEGEFKNDKYKGYGFYYFELNNFEYKGKWSEGYPSGYGFLNFCNIFQFERCWNKKFFEYFFTLIQIILSLLYFFAKLFKLNKRTYILIIILIISIIINV